MHPLTPNLQELTDAELQAKVFELAKKLRTANNLGNYYLLSQVQLMYNDYLEENKRRDQAKLQSAIDSSGKNFDGIININ
ncbi:hypothetical protein UFOVP116_333 [uncultured Caudovirales phage]|uniref:Uncharacterized protein n=1 Tax=uncultured Caudovirales phage TaxID=2100421 RepID=A0A6J5LB29_9CAUD|nr:hypothetical protein UFOVP116_333 [uncultured Caudovirales phage]